MKLYQSFISAIGAVLLTTQSFAAGLLSPSNQSLPDLQIKSHDVNVIIEDGYAITTVDQVFYNQNNQDLEAHYSFPVPDKAAVSEFTVWIDGQPQTGEVLEKQQAKQVYEQEKAAGKDAGLMEKDSYKTFDIKVTPVRALSETKTRFSYMQPVHVDTGIGRYVYPLEEGGTDTEKLSFWTSNEAVKERFSFNMDLRSSYPVSALRMPNQPQAIIQQHNAQQWNIGFGESSDSSEEGVTQQTQTHAYQLDKDLVVYWRLQEGLDGSVDLVSYKAPGSDKGTFMLTLTPGDDLKPITEGSDWVFILDISGSMQGKFHTLVDGVEKAIKKMRPNDRFQIVLFNNNAQALTGGFVNATQNNITHYLTQLSAVNPNNGTNLYSGLLKGLKTIDADRTSSIILVTDGVANVGETKQKKFIELLNKKDIRLFTFIMGNSSNKPLLKAMTKASNGFAVNVSNSDDIVGKVLEASSKVTHESLHGVKLDISGIKTANVTPKSIGSLYRGQQLVVFGHYWGEGLADIKLSGKVSGETKHYSTQINFAADSALNPELERLWAFASIEQMQQSMEDFGDDADTKQAIVDLSTEYGIVTDYTSMVVVSDKAFESLGIKQTNKQRLNTEKQTQQQRVAAPVKSNRVDNSQPMFKAPRPSYSGGSSGGGSMNVGFIVLLMGVFLVRFKKQLKA